MKKEKINPFQSTKRAVEDSAELQRILALPRREWESKADEYVRALTQFLRKPGGTQTLRAIQATALVEMHDHRGLLMPAAVGSGKGLTSLLSFFVLEARRPLLLLPAALIDKTRKEAYEYSKHWVIPPFIRMESYEKLGRPDHANLLQEAEPDVIVADECHRLRNTGAASTKRVKRYLETHPNTIFVGMSGTIMKRSILDFAHLAFWALRHKNPTPVTFQDRQAWAMALDEKREGETRLAPGALVKLCTPEDRQALMSATSVDEALGVVRRSVMRRVMDTPGIVATRQKLLGTSLRIENVIVRGQGKPHFDALEGLRERWERPDGEPLLDAIELWRHCREVACGFFYRWNPAPPEVWRDRRREWASYVRTILRTNRINLDSEATVVRAIEQGLYPAETLNAWREVRGLYDPEEHKEAVWLDPQVLYFCERWMFGTESSVPKSTQGGIVWVEHTEFGRMLSRRTGISYYQQGGLDANGRNIEDHPADQPLIASIDSNATGRNLQKWNTNLVVSPPQNGARWEQLLGRTHREGQEADEVTYQIITAIPEQLDSFDRARGDARAIEELTGQPQKLGYGDVIITPFGASEQVKRRSSERGDWRERREDQIAGDGGFGR